MRAPRLGFLPAAIALAFLLPACQFFSPRPPQSVPSRSPLPEIGQYLDAHRRSLALRRDLDTLPQGVAAGAHLSQETQERLETHKREYFAIREVLFRIVFLHASAIVENPEGRDVDALLVKTSLALRAGTDLVKNFHAVAATLSGAVAPREVWNEADHAHGIPEGSWEISVSGYRNARYHDLFREALERLKRYRRRLESFREGGDGDLLALYPQGISAVIHEAEQTYALLRERFAEEDLSQDAREVRALVERSKSLRSAWAAAGPVLREAIVRDRGLIRGNVHARVHAAKREYLDLREALYRLAFKHAPKLTRHDIAYPPRFRLRAIAISLLAAITLYENARHVETHILTVPGVKALLNQGDPALGIPPHFWDHVEREFTRVEYRNLLEAGLRALEAEQSLPGQSPGEDDPLLTYVGREIAASAAIAEMREEYLATKIARVLGYYVRRLNALGPDTLRAGNVQFSKTFGNLLGMFEFRKGKLFDQPQWVHFVKERLQPGDLLLEKTPFRLTDKFIPGHFGHVALYVGETAQLRELGVLTHPWVASHETAVSEGRTIVEALRSGTQITTLDHFLNIDDLAILRPKTDAIPHADVMQAITLAFSHIGKKYDFGFDNNSWDAIVCSELAFHTYVHVRWPFAKVLSSYTISPDDVAVLAGSDPSRPFDLITFIHDGRVVHDSATGVQNEALYIHLLGKRYTEAIH